MQTGCAPSPGDTVRFVARYRGTQSLSRSRSEESVERSLKTGPIVQVLAGQTDYD
jgi:hypothetical protein